MRIRLSDHFTYKKLLLFTLPSIMMMIFTSIYGVVDGFFVSNFAGKNAFAAVNFIIPFLSIWGGLGFMFGAGGSALIGKTLGEGDHEKANRIFSLITYVSLILGGILAVFCFIFLEPIAVSIGATPEILEDCLLYGRIIALTLPAYILQNEFQAFSIAAEKPQFGLIVSLITGCGNILLDALCVGILGWGIAGAAIATAISQFAGGIVFLIYFFRPNDSLLHLSKTTMDNKALIKTVSNGVSELVNNVSMCAVSMLYNLQLIRYAGEDGVAAYGVLMYVSFIFYAIFIGFTAGSSPIISYHFGAQNHTELKNLRKKIIRLIAIFSVLMLFGGELLAQPFSYLYVGYDADLFTLTCRGFYIFSFSFLFGGMAVLGSAFFTALNDGMTSAIISFLRTMVFQIGAVLLLPLWFGIDGIWFSLVLAEIAAFFLTIFYIVIKRKKYHY